MKVLPYAAIFTFVAGLSLLVAGFAFSNGEDPQPPPAGIPFDLRTPETPTNTPTPLPTDVPTATPTPLPFDGNIARMVAPSVGIDHPIEEIGITNNQLDTPKDGVGKVGWYHIYAKPGFGQNAVFAAHVNYNFKQGPFANLARIKAGDQITIQMENGPSYTYEVIFYQRYDVRTIPMGELVSAPSRPEGEEWITLITCGGRFQQTQDNGLGEYLDRDVVIAKRIA
jgi:LPXTG-site transpeptidase (sortase) family protein